MKLAERILNSIKPETKVEEGVKSDFMNNSWELQLVPHGKDKWEANLAHKDDGVQWAKSGKWKDVSSVIEPLWNIDFSSDSATVADALESAGWDSL